jgi:hypothetical protein
MNEINARKSSQAPSYDFLLFPILGCETLEEYNEKAEEVADKLLNGKVDWPKVSKKQFAMRLLGAHVEATSLEGSNSATSARYWQSLFDFWQKGERLFIHANLPSHDLPEILSDYEAFCSLSAEDFLNKIKEVLQKKGSVYVPFGYRAGPLNGGHAIPAYIEQNKDEIIVHLLNGGEGAQNHPLLEIKSTVAKYHMRYFPIHFKKSDFFGEKGLELFTKLLLFRTETPERYHPGYSSDDIYGLLWIYGSVQEEFKKKVELRNSTPQLGPVCGDHAPILVIKDHLIERGCAKKAMKRFFLNEHICCLLGFYHTHVQDEKKNFPLMLKRGCEELSIRSLKLFHAQVISEEELLIAQILMEKLLATAHEKLKKIQSPPLKGFSIVPTEDASEFKIDIKPINETFHKMSIREKLRARQQQRTRLDSSPISEDVASNLSSAFSSITTSLQNLFLQVQKVNGAARYQSWDKGFFLLYRQCLSLPLPSASGDDPWDTIPVESIGPLIEFFTEIAWGTLARVRMHKAELNFQTYLTLLTLYALADRLALRNPENKLNGFSFFLSDPFSHLPRRKNQKGEGDFSAILDGLENKRYVALKTYFQERNEKAPLVLFRTHSAVDIGAEVKNLRDYENCRTPLSSAAAQLKYLVQFLTREEISSPFYQLCLANLWIGREGNRIPRDFGNLFYLHRLINDRFPSNLEPLPYPEGNPWLLQSTGSQLIVYYFPPPKPDETTLHNLFSPSFLRDGGTHRSLCASTKKVNEVMCEKELGELLKGLPLSMQKKVARIFLERKLQVFTLLQVMEENLYSFHDGGLQKALMLALFAPGVLDEAITHDPSLIPRLRKTVDLGMDLFNSDLSTLLFFIRVAIHLESHFILQGSVDQGRLTEIERKIMGRIQKEVRKPLLCDLYGHLFLLYRFAIPSGPESIVYLIRGRFLLAFPEAALSEETKKENFPLLGGQLALLHQEAYSASCQEAGRRNHLLDSIIIALIPEKVSSLSEKWEGEFPKYSSGTITINLNTLEIRDKNDGKLAVMSRARFYDGLLAWYRGKDQYRSRDGLSEQEFNDEGRVEVFRRSFFGKDYYLMGSQYQTPGDAPCLWLNLDFLNYTGFFTASAESSPRYGVKIDAKTGEQEIFLLAQNGTFTPWKLLSSIAIDPDLSALLSQLGFTKQGCRGCYCWYNVETSRVEKIDFYDLGLSFSLEKGGLQQRFVCKQHPHLFLNPRKTLPAIPDLVGGCMLEDEAGSKQYAFIIQGGTTAKNDDFATTVHTNPCSVFQVSRYFICEVDPLTDRLCTQVPAQNLFLSTVYAALRDFPKALFHLQHSQEFAYITSASSPILSFTRLPDKSPEALGFYMHVGLHFIRNQGQLLREGYGHQGKKDYDPDMVFTTFYQWLEKCFCDYLRALSSKEINRVAGYLRLEPEDEILLLKFLKNLSEQRVLQIKQKKLAKGQEIPFSAQLKIRLDYLEGRETSASISPTTYFPPRIHPPFTDEFSLIDDQSLYHPAIQTEETPPPFIRLGLGRLPHYFPYFYRKAQKGDLKVDLFLLSRSGIADSTKELRVLFYILCLVNSYPEHFSEIAYVEGGTIEEKRAIFSTICKLCSVLTKLFFEKARKVNHVLDRTLFFNYTKEAPPLKQKKRMACSISWQFSQSHSESLALYAHSRLYAIIQKYTTCSWLSPPFLKEERPFLFSSKEKNPLSLTEKILIEGLIQGDAKNRKQKIDHYSISSENRSLLIGDLQKEAEQLRKEKAELQEKAESLANTTYFLGGKPPRGRIIAHAEQRLRGLGRDLPRITMADHLTEACRKKNPALIWQKNPSLSEAQVEEILLYTLQFHLVSYHLCQVEIALEKIKSHDQEGFDMCLRATPPDPIQSPSLLIFQSAQKILLRPMQRELLEWIDKAPLNGKENKLLVFAFPAGEGKTSVINPLLIGKIFEEGFLPISISQRSLYELELEQLAASMQTVGSSLNCWELSLKDELTASDLEWIYNKLQECLQKKQSVKITPEVWYAIDLHYQLALEEKHEDKVLWFSQILAFFETSCVAIIDESRVNLNPRCQAKIGIGKPVPLPGSMHRLFLHIYQIITPLVGLEVGEQTKLSQEQQVRVREKLALNLLDYPLLANLGKKEKELLLFFWKNKEAKLPEELSNQEKEIAATIYAVKAYLHEFFSVVMGMVRKMQYTPHPMAGKEIATPALRRIPTGDFFEDPYMTLLLTIHTALEDGLSKEQFTRLIQKIRTDLHDDPRLEQTFQLWTKDDQFSLKAIEEDMSLFVYNHYPDLCRNRELIFYFLEKLLLLEVTHTPEQVESTPQDLLHGFHKVITFSADPGPSEIYTSKPLGESLYRSDPSFVASVSHHLTAPQNQTVIRSSTRDPQELFPFLWTHQKDLLLTLGSLTDVSGFFCDYSTEEVASSFIDFIQKEKAPFHGMVFFVNEGSSELCLWLKEWNEPKRLPPGKIEEVLPLLGYNWEELNLVTLYDPGHTTGAHIKQKKGALTLLLIGEEVPQSEIVQGTMRSRDFMNSQPAAWCVYEPLATKIEQQQQTPLSSQTILKWSLKEEAKTICQEVVPSAYQQIDWIVKSPAKKSLKEALDDPQQQIAIWHGHREGFVKKANHKPLNRFSSPLIDEKTDTVLLRYAKKAYARFDYGYWYPWDNATTLHAPVNSVIKGVQKHLPTLSNRSSDQCTRRSQTHVQEQKNTVEDKHQIDALVVTPDEESLDYKNISLNHTFLLSYLQGDSYHIQKLFNSTGLSSCLFVTENALCTARTGNRSLRKKYFTPSLYLLAVEENRQCSFFALSDHEAAHFQKLLRGTPPKISGRGIALFGTDGRLVQNGKGQLALNADKVMQSVSFLDSLIDIGLMSCRLFDRDRFEQRLKKWEDFGDVWAQMKDGFIHPHECNPISIEVLVPPEHLKTSAEKSSKSSSSFFSFLNW